MSKVVLFDVDGTIGHTLHGNILPRPGIHAWLESLRLLGYDIHLWSARGAVHAHDIAQQLGLPHIAATHEKPADDCGIHALFTALGEICLIVDDDEAWLDRFPRMPRMRVTPLTVPEHG